MTPKQKQQLKKTAKHKQHVAALNAKAKAKFNKQAAYQSAHGKVSLMHKLKYEFLISPGLIAHHYDEIITPRVKLLQDPNWSLNNVGYNEKDNRELFANLNYISNHDQTVYSYHMYGGIVLNYRFVMEKDFPHLYLLVGDVKALVHQANETHTHRKFDGGMVNACDHLWIDAAGQFMAFNPATTEIQMGLGDAILFAGSVTEYRGKRENIWQTKYGLEDVHILDSGYPFMTHKDKAASVFSATDWTPMHTIHYRHKSTLLSVKVNYNRKTETLTNQFILGTQWRPEDNPYVDQLKTYLANQNLLANDEADDVD